MLRYLPFRMIGVAALALAAAATVAWAQKAPEQIDGATLLNGDPVENSQYLGSVFKDETNGFKLTPPAKSEVVTRKGIDLMSFIVESKGWAGSLQRPVLVDPVTGKPSPMTLEEMMTNTQNEIKKVFKGVQVRQSPLTFEGRRAVRFDTSMVTMTGDYLSSQDHRMGAATQPARGPQKQEEVLLFRQQLIVEASVDEKTGKAGQFYFLTLDAPLKDREAATRTFEAMLPEFELFDQKKIVERRVQAEKDGREWLAKTSAEQFVKKIRNQPQFFLIRIDGKNVGFIQLDESAESRDRNGNTVDLERRNRKGVLMTVKFATFPGGLSYGQIEEFWALPKDAKGEELGEYSEWDVKTKGEPVKDPLPPSQVPPGGSPYVLRVPWMEETGSISQDSPHQRPHIIVFFGGDSREPLPKNISVDMPEGNAPAPLPKVLEYTWPRFVDVTKPSEMSFTTYDSRNNKLAVRNLIVTGKLETIKVNGSPTTGYKLIDEIDPNNTTLWVTKEGEIELMKTSDQSIMQPTTLDNINHLWPNRPSE